MDPENNVPEEKNEYSSANSKHKDKDPTINIEEQT